jgi:DNA replication protein DnaC
MKNVGDLMKRLQKMMPANVKPAFTTGKNCWRGKKSKEKSVPPRSPAKTGR